MLLTPPPLPEHCVPGWESTQGPRAGQSGMPINADRSGAQQMTDGNWWANTQSFPLPGLGNSEACSTETPSPARGE